MAELGCFSWGGQKKILLSQYLYMKKKTEAQLMSFRPLDRLSTRLRRNGRMTFSTKLNKKNLRCIFFLFSLRTIKGEGLPHALIFSLWSILSLALFVTLLFQEVEVKN